ncbi:MAG: 50S ribosomal protein L29, partial [Thermodesulfobacteriota bacterium]
MKAKEFRDMTAEEIATKEGDLKKELFSLRMQNSMGQA